MQRAARRGARRTGSEKKARPRRYVCISGAKPPAERNVTFQDLRRIDYDAIFNGRRWPHGAFTRDHYRKHSDVLNTMHEANFETSAKNEERSGCASYESVNNKLERANWNGNPKLLVIPSRLSRDFAAWPTVLKMQ